MLRPETVNHGGCAAGVISKHQYIPTVSPKKICVHKCGSEVHNNVASPASLMKKSSAGEFDVHSSKIGLVFGFVYSVLSLPVF